MALLYDNIQNHNRLKVYVYLLKHCNYTKKIINTTNKNDKKNSLIS